MRSALLTVLLTLLSSIPTWGQDDVSGQTTETQGIVLRGCRMGSTPKGSNTQRALMTERLPGGDFYHGDRRQLVVLVAFADQDFQGDEASTLAQWDKIFNQQQLNEAPFTGSVHDYFFDQSYGQLRLTFDLQYVKLSEGKKKYRSTNANDENSKYLVSDIVDELLTRDIDWSQYDWNGDGYINQIVIVYAGKGMGFGGDSNSIWPHQWWLSEHTDCQPRTVTYGGNSYTVDNYCCVQEIYSNGSYGTFGTICHEYSHCFGFPDFYSVGTSFLGHWELMDYGNNNNGGFTPCGYSAHERMLMGWLTPTELSEATTVSDMPVLADEPQAYLIRNDGYDNEYYIVENRQQKGWDSSLPGSGIVVFHIDYDPSLWTSVTQSVNMSSRKRYHIFQANNYTSTGRESGWAYPYAANNQLTDTSVPAATLLHENANGSMLMGKPLTDMAVSDGLGSFLFMGGATGIDGIMAEGEGMLSEAGARGGEQGTRQGVYDLHGRWLGNNLRALPHGLYIVRKGHTTRTVTR